MIKKTMMLAGIALAAIAFAAPAAAQAEANWLIPSTEETIGGEGEAAPIHAVGNLNWVLFGAQTSINLTLQGFAWNEGGMGVGVIAEVAAGIGTVAGVPAFLDCTVEATPLSTPWGLTLTTDTSETATTETSTLDIENFHVIYHYNAGCQAAGLPATVGVIGTVTTTLENEPNGEDSILTLEGGDLHLTNNPEIAASLFTSGITVTGAQVEQH